MSIMDYMELIPITLLTLLFIGFQNDDRHHMTKECKKTLIKVIISLLVMGFLFFMLIHTNINKFILIIIAIMLWLILYFIKRNFI